MLGAAQRAGVDDAGWANDFVAAAVGVAVKNIVVAIADEGIELAGDVAVRGGDAHVGDEFAGEMVGGYAAGIQFK